VNLWALGFPSTSTTFVLLEESFTLKKGRQEKFASISNRNAVDLPRMSRINRGSSGEISIHCRDSRGYHRPP
jgi:hypothetical protein